MTLSEDDEGLAAEYALGTLDAGERAAVAARRQREPVIDQAIAEWEARLAPLALNLSPRDPPANLFSRVEAAIGAARPADFAAALQRRVARWRALAGGAGLVAAGLAAALVFVVVTRPPAGRQFVAVLQRDANSPAFAMTVDVDRQEFTVRPISATPPPNKSYELWLISPDLGAPKSLGLVDTPRPDGRSLSAYGAAAVQNATYAITEEPKGGSPTGQPTSAPIFAGKLIPIGP